MELYNHPLHTHIHIISIILLLPHLHLKWAIALNSLLHSPIQKHQLPHHHKLLLVITIITLDHHQIWDILMLMGMVTAMLLDNSNQDLLSNLVQQQQEAIITIIILHLNTIQQAHIILHQHHRLPVDRSHMLEDLTVPLHLLLQVQQRHHLLILAHITNSSLIIIILDLHHTIIQVVVLYPPLPLQSLILICLVLSLNQKITEESIFSP